MYETENAQSRKCACFTHTHTLSQYHRFAIFVMMLFMLMFKTDVGWGQVVLPPICPNNLLQNPKCTINSGVTDGFDAFCDGEVASWGGVDNTPHIIQKNQINPNFGCSTDINDPNSTVACLRSGPGFPNGSIITESIYQTGINFSQDPLVSYSVDISANLLECGMLNSYTNMDVYLLNSNTIPSSCLFLSQGWIPPANSSNNIMSEVVNWYGQSTLTQNISLPNSNYNAIYVRSWKPFMASDPSQTVLGISEVSLTCSTTALTDLTFSNPAGLNYEFHAVNSSTISVFSKYLWKVMQECTNQQVFQSDLENPTFTFPEGGKYQICLDIQDNNGCCATRCEEVVVECDDPVATFTLQGTCPNYYFVPIVLDENLTYLWAVNGNVVGNNGVQSYTFTENGIYTIELAVTNCCGEKAIVCITITVDCICDDPAADFNFTVNCVERQGNASFEVTNGQLGDTYVWNFGDGSPNVTTTSTTTNHTYVSSQTYTVILTVINECGETQTIQKEVTVICDALCGPTDGAIAYTIDGRNGGITLSQAFTNLGIAFNPGIVNVYNNMHFNIYGTVTFDISTEFLSTDFVAYEGALIILDGIATGPTNKGLSTFYGCNFYGCEQMWQGIRTEGHTANFLGGMIRDAFHGINVMNDGHLTVRGVTLSHNFVGIVFNSNPSHLIVGNHFTGGPLLSAYSGMPAFGNKNLCGIYSGGVVYSDDFTTSSGTYSLNVGVINDVRNVFDNMDNGIICRNTFNVNIKNNSFLNFPIDNNVTAVNPGIINFGLNTTSSGNGVMVGGGGFFGGVYFEDNQFENGTIGILSSAIPSELSIRNTNKFKNMEVGVYAKDNNTIFPLNLEVENNNEFDCRNKGVFSNNNLGHNDRAP